MFHFMFKQSIGAVNTIIRRAGDGKLVGYNTDCEAAITAIEDALVGNSPPLLCLVQFPWPCQKV